MYLNHKDSNELHPKPSLVTQLVNDGLRDEGKVIVFTEYRDTVDNVISILETNDSLELEDLSARQARWPNWNETRANRTIRALRNGELNVLVATSVGEEGLDVPAADSVILRAGAQCNQGYPKARKSRQRDGDVHILIAKGLVTNMFNKRQ